MSTDNATPGALAAGAEPCVVHRIFMSHVENRRSDGVVREVPRPPWTRSEGFERDYDYFTAFYDVFQADAEDTVIAIGPPMFSGPGAITLPQARALPSGPPCRIDIQISPRNQAVRYRIAAPPGTTGLLLQISGQEWTIPVQPNLLDRLAGCRALVTKSKDNDLAWIRDWAAHHVARFGIDCVILYDNASTRYAPSDVERALRGVSGLRHVVVVDQPAPWGARSSIYSDSEFMQTAMLVHALERFLRKADLYLNLDIDELAIDFDGEGLDHWFSDGQPVLALRRRHAIGPAGLGDGSESVRHAACWYRDPRHGAITTKWAARPALLSESAMPDVHIVAGAEYRFPPAESIEIAHMLPVNRRDYHAPRPWRWSLKFPDSPVEVAAEPVEDAGLRGVLRQSLGAEPTPPIAPWGWTDADHPDLLLRGAGELLDAGRTDEAILALERCLALEPEAVDAASLLADIRDDEGNAEAAAALRRRVERLTQDNPHWALKQAFAVLEGIELPDIASGSPGIRAVDRPEIDEAIALLERVEHADQLPLDVLWLLANLRVINGDFEGSVHAYRRALALVEPGSNPDMTIRGSLAFVESRLNAGSGG